MDLSNNDLTGKVIEALLTKARVPLMDMRQGRVMLLREHLLCPLRMVSAVSPHMEELGVPLLVYDDSDAVEELSEAESEAAFDAVASVLFGTEGLEDVPFLVTQYFLVLITRDDEQGAAALAALASRLRGGPCESLLLLEVRPGLDRVHRAQALRTVFDGIETGIDVEGLSRLLHSTGSVDEFLRSLS